VPPNRPRLGVRPPARRALLRPGDAERNRRGDHACHWAGPAGRLGPTPRGLRSGPAVYQVTGRLRHGRGAAGPPPLGRGAVGRADTGRSAARCARGRPIDSAGRRATARWLGRPIGSERTAGSKDGCRASSRPSGRGPSRCSNASLAGGRLPARPAQRPRRVRRARRSRCARTPGSAAAESPRGAMRATSTARRTRSSVRRVGMVRALDGFRNGSPPWSRVSGQRF
jgi:hypothetical protein